MAEYVVHVQEEKTTAINLLKENFKDVKDFLFADYRGLDVASISKLRNLLRESQAEMKVAKKTLIDLAER